MGDVPLLRAETLVSVSDLDRVERLNLVEQLQKLPPEAISRLQYLQPQVGCFQQCAFCSQVAGRDLWQLTRNGLRNVIAALAEVCRERRTGAETALLGTGRDRHRPGVLFPYLDNDIGGYPYLDDYISWVASELGCKVRLATVGFSAENQQLVRMHTRIARDLVDALAGVRFSWTPYTLGWTDRRNGGPSTSRGKYISDFGSMLCVYRPTVAELGTGSEGVSVELRFAPNVVTDVGELIDTIVCNRHVIALGPHILISEQPSAEPVPETHLLRVVNRRPVFSTDGLPYQLITSDAFVNDDPVGSIERVLAGSPTTAMRRRHVSLFRFRNNDGSYYAVDPTFLPNGKFVALHLYPSSPTRRAGYTDATRHFLNTVIGIKRRFNVRRRDEWKGARRVHVDSVFDTLNDQVAVLRRFDVRAAEHLNDNIIPLARGYATALNVGGYEPSWFFHPRFSVDTGQIVNQGRAKGLFRGLASCEDEPMTPHEERGYGQTSESADRGLIWRIAPMPYGNGARSRAGRGGKNDATVPGVLQVQELDPQHLRPTRRSTGSPLREYRLTGSSMEHLDLDQGTVGLAYPGLSRHAGRPASISDATMPSMKAPRKAVISTAGFGSRFFPVSVAVNKCMLPILNRPVIDYMVSELVTAGVTDIAIVTLPGDDQIRRYFEETDWIKRYFYDREWESKYSPIAELHERLSGITFAWIEQPVDGRYGTAIPALLARTWVGDEDWFLASGDDVILRADGGSNLADLVATRADAGVPAALQVTKVPQERVSRYGIVCTRKHDGYSVLDGAVEKPRPEDAPSNLASISRFLLGPDFFTALDELKPDPDSGEYLSISALINYARENPVLVHTISGEYYDCGQPNGWLEANNAAARLAH